MRVTLDTSIFLDKDTLSVDDLIASVLPGLFEFSIVSVTDREMGILTKPGFNYGITFSFGRTLYILVASRRILMRLQILWD